MKLRMKKNYINIFISIFSYYGCVLQKSYYSLADLTSVVLPYIYSIFSIHFVLEKITNL